MADRIWTADCVADHFEEAFRTLRKLPPVKAQGFFNAWPRDRPHQPRDRGDGARADAGLALGRRDHPARADLRLGALDRGGERKLVWSRAARVPWKQISGELGCDRTTAWRRWQLALTKIAARLNAQRLQCVATLFPSTSAT
jgi:hypothetical protein